MFNFGPSPDVMNRYLPPGIGSAPGMQQGLPPGMGNPVQQPQPIDVGAPVDPTIYGPRMPRIGGSNGMPGPMMPPQGGNMMPPPQQPMQRPSMRQSMGAMNGGKPLGPGMQQPGMMQRFAGMSAQNAAPMVDSLLFNNPQQRSPFRR